MTELEQIKLLDTSLWLYVQNGLSASAAELFLTSTFYGYPEEKLEQTFRSHVGNNIVYNAIDALISRSVVGAYETIRVHQQSFGELPFVIPELETLKSHRTYLSHSENVTWEKKSMERFIEDELHVKDFKAVRLFEAREATRNFLIKGGLRDCPSNGAIATSGIVHMIRACLLESLHEGVALPPSLSSNIVHFFGKFNELLTQNSTLSEIKKKKCRN